MKISINFFFLNGEKISSQKCYRSSKNHDFYNPLLNYQKHLPKHYNWFFFFFLLIYIIYSWYIGQYLPNPGQRRGLVLQDVMFSLIFQHLIPCTFLIPSYRYLSVCLSVLLFTVVFVVLVAFFQTTAIHFGHFSNNKYFSCCEEGKGI